MKNFAMWIINVSKNQRYNQNNKQKGTQFHRRVEEWKKNPKNGHQKKAIPYATFEI